MPDLQFGKPGEYLTDRLTDEALNVIDRARGQPFFVYLAHYGVHIPLEAKRATSIILQQPCVPACTTRT